jgi:beta-glucosidase
MASDSGPESTRSEAPPEPEELVEAMTREEKMGLVHGTHPTGGRRADGATGYIAPVERLDVPALRLADGPLGMRVGTATAFPASLALGAAFDTELAERFGRALATEARAKGMDVVLAPGCNLLRVPQCGRAFEYYGEDPLHAGRLTAATVRGIQSRDVVATPKHYVANNQERERVEVSAEVSERALRELYLPAFERAVTGGDAGAVMAAYNRVNGTYADEHEALLTDVLKREFGFDGPVMSDWWAVRDGPAAAAAGLDLEMPGTTLGRLVAMSDERRSALHAVSERWPDVLPTAGDVVNVLAELSGVTGGTAEIRSSVFEDSLPEAMAAGRLSESRLDEMARRVLTLHERVGALAGTRASVEVDRSAHRELATELAVSGSVLLRNDGTLPLGSEMSVALVGPNVDEAKIGGGGSSEVTPPRTVSPAAGIRERSGGTVTVEPGHPPVENSSMFELSLDLPFGGSPSVDRGAIERAVGDTEVAVVVVQDDATETRDRELRLPGAQDRLISAVADEAESTVVVLQTAGPVEMPWLGAVDAVLECWYPGQEGGHALAALLYGDADPGGRLPVTFGLAAGEYPASTHAQYPGHRGTEAYPEVQYDEGVFVGYRGFDERGVEVLFPFGHGLSYATFEYVDVEADDGQLSVTVGNTGERAGRDVVQAYLRDPDPRLPRPPRELAGFEAVTLAPGERTTVTVDVDDRAFAVYDEAVGDWVTEPGEYVLEVGRSSRAICERVTVDREGSA